MRDFFLALANRGNGLRQLYFQSSKFSWQKTSLLPGVSLDVLRLLKSNLDGDGDVSFSGDASFSGDVSFMAASARKLKPSLPIQGEVVVLLPRSALGDGVRPVHAP